MKKPYQSDPHGAIGGMKQAGDAIGSVLNSLRGGELKSHPGKGHTVLDLGMSRLRTYAADLGMITPSIALVESRAKERFAEAEALLDSPIERSMLAGLLTGRWSGFSTIPPIIHNAAKGSVEHFPQGEIVIVPQMAFLKYRLDMGIVISEGMHKRIFAVECDGAAFHGNPTADLVRDGYLASWGIQTFRFSGARINQDALTCADEVIAAICGVRFGDGF